MGNPLKKVDIPEVVLDTGNIHKGFLHGIVERGGEIIFRGFPFKIVFLPDGDFIKYHLVACGKKPDKSKYFNPSPIKKEVTKKDEDVKKTTIVGEYEI